MKRIIFAFSVLALAASAHAQSEPTLQPTAFNAIYVPGGFDSNDNVQIVGEGLFRNTCYRPAATDFSVDQDKKIVTVKPSAYHYGGFCLEVLLPFDRVVDVGILKPGSYSIVQDSDRAPLGTFNVTPARTDSADEYLYAPVSQAFFKQAGTGGQVMLTGYFLTNCMSLDRVKVTVEPKVLVLQPIVKLEQRDNSCLRGRFPFSKLVKIDSIPKGRYLLHVRSMNGQAVNTLFDQN